MDELIALCWQNIDEFKDVCEQCKKYNQSIPLGAPAFERLAIIYERQGRYEEAIAVCVEAIDCGIEDTKYNQRIARLVKKADLDISEEIKETLLK